MRFLVAAALLVALLAGCGDKAPDTPTTPTSADVPATPTQAVNNGTIIDGDVIKPSDNLTAPPLVTFIDCIVLETDTPLQLADVEPYLPEGFTQFSYEGVLPIGIGSQGTPTADLTTLSVNCDRTEGDVVADNVAIWILAFPVIAPEALTVNNDFIVLKVLESDPELMALDQFAGLDSEEGTVDLSQVNTGVGLVLASSVSGDGYGVTSTGGGPALGGTDGFPVRLFAVKDKQPVGILDARIGPAVAYGGPGVVQVASGTVPGPAATAGMGIALQLNKFDMTWESLTATETAKANDA